MKTVFLVLVLAVSAIAQTRIDYNGNQLSNKPVTRVASPSVPLATTFAALTAGGTLVIPSGTYTISTTVSVTQSNVTILCQPGAQINAGANNIIVFTTAVTGVTFTGCKFDGNSHTGVRFLSAGGAGNDFTATWCTFQNDAYASASNAFGVQMFTAHSLTLNHNRYLNIGGGVAYQNVEVVDIQDEYFEDIGILRCIGGSVAYNTFPLGATAYINNNTGKTIAAYAIEITSPGIRSIVVTNNSFTDLTQDGASIPMCFAGQTCQSESAIISNNTFIGNVSSNGLAIEAYGNGLQIIGNVITGPFSTGILWTAPGETRYSAPGAIISYNTITGTHGGITTNAGGGISDYSLIEGNSFYNNRDFAISFGGVSPGSKIIHNQDFRAPGYWTGDGARIYSAFVAVDTGAGASPMLFEGNYATVLAPVNAYALPGTMLWSCLRTSNTNSATSPATFRDNVCENLNVTSFGQRFYGTSDSLYANILITGQKYINLTTPAAFTEYSSSAAIKYSNNQALAGLGGAAYTDFTIGNAIFSGTVRAVDLILSGAISTTPTCVTGVALDGIGGTNCSAGVVGTPYQGYVALTASGTPSSTPGAVIFTLTFAASAFSAIPKCVWSNADSRTYAAFYSLASTSTSGVWGLAGAALVAASNYRLTYSCPKN